MRTLKLTRREGVDEHFAGRGGLLAATRLTKSGDRHMIGFTYIDEHGTWRHGEGSRSHRLNPTGWMRCSGTG